MDLAAHWEGVYRQKSPEQMSWYQREASLSLALIGRVAPDLGAALLDVGGGASTLVDGLLAAGRTGVAVLDLSDAALGAARARLGAAAARVTWRAADILAADLPPASVDLWHDRAVFHFLTSPDDRRRYVEQVRRALRPGGHALVASFAEDGPLRCSGLDVVRYSSGALHGEFGAGFRLLDSVREEHLTPWGARQSFVYCVCRWDRPGASRSAA